MNRSFESPIGNVNRESKTLTEIYFSDKHKNGSFSSPDLNRFAHFSFLCLVIYITRPVCGYCTKTPFSCWIKLSRFMAIVTSEIKIMQANIFFRHLHPRFWIKPSSPLKESKTPLNVSHRYRLPVQEYKSASTPNMMAKNIPNSSSARRIRVLKIDPRGAKIDHVLYWRLKWWCMGCEEGRLELLNPNGFLMTRG